MNSFYEHHMDSIHWHYRFRRQTHIDRHRRYSERSDFHRDERSAAVAPRLLHLWRRPGQRTHKPIPHDIQLSSSEIWCMVIKPSLEKTANWRVVPIHSHVITQEFLKYVEKRKKLGKPLFYEPDRSRDGKPGNPQFKKVAERLGEWVHCLGVPVGVKPDHAWRHLFKSIARDVKDRAVEGFITGHRPKDSNAGNDYGDRWIKTISAEIEKYPRIKIAALRQPPAPHKRHRRTNAEVARRKRQGGAQSGPCDAGHQLRRTRSGRAKPDLRLAFDSDKALHVLRNLSHFRMRWSMDAYECDVVLPV